MRVDVRTDPRYVHKDLRPFLDGVELFGCFMADEEAGVAWVFATDECGKRHAYYPEPGRIRHHGEPQVDPYEECVVEVHGTIELRKIAEAVAS